MANPLFFHVDLDAFFASVEILDNPKLKGKPLIIGHPGPRSVVSTCSYEARKYGVHSAMPMVTALKLCPKAIVIRGNMKRYSEMSHKVMSILSSYAPKMIQASIDEAYLDMTGCEKIYGEAVSSAKNLKERIKSQTGLTASIGVGSSKFIAKLASDYRKPDGLTVVPYGLEQDFVDAVGLNKLWGIGKATLENLHKHHIYTTEELRSLSQNQLASFFGSSLGEYLYKIVRGIDPGIYSGESKSHSISSERTFYPDLFDQDAIDAFLLELSQEVMFRSMQEKMIAKTIGLKLRYASFKTYTLQSTPDRGIYTTKDVYEEVKMLFKKKHTGEGIRLLGVGLYSLYSGEEQEQPELFSSDKERERKLEKVILSLNLKGNNIVRATSLAKRKVKDNEN
ncbi:MAG: DNA polymerase IV [Spirochaetales bacterium]|uniref:DNA polymerase IV n=1 Tax=Bullifex sp. TaxID=2815808 RepID=UPI002A5896ED|nr:DNA polymerase IV [Bullifex sp.]MDD7271024.1 DNA polymerase IV [Spirochaetales bacterium]MDY4066619.1 DNA polymerase IV [Bullifex sp.]